MFRAAFAAKEKSRGCACQWLSHARKKTKLGIRACHEASMLTGSFANNGNGNHFLNNSKRAATIAIAGAIAAILGKKQAGGSSKLEGNESFSRGEPIATSFFSAQGGFSDQHGTASRHIKSPPPLGLNGTKNETVDVRGLNRALHQMQERQKVQFGRLLHQFQALVAEEESHAEGGSDRGLSAADVEAVDPNTVLDAQSSSAVHDDAKFTVRIRETDLTKLDPMAAAQYINRLREGAVFHPHDVKRIAHAASELLLTEPTLIDLRERNEELKTVTVVGDLHGQFSCLFDVLGLLQGCGMPWDGSGAIVFNGDFVDRGSNSLEVMLTILLLKLAYPDHVYINRGNHEDSVLSTVYGYTDELQERYGNDSVDDIWEAFGDVFSALPLCVRTNEAVIMHGGLPSEDFDLTELERVSPEERSCLKSILEPGEDKLCQLVQNILWSDPRPEDGIARNEDRGAGMKFGPDVLRRFLSKHRARLFIRSHEPVDAGYEHLECSDEHSAVTVFSASRYPEGEGYNYGAVIRLHADGTYEPVSFEGQFPDPVEEEDEQLEGKFCAITKLIAQNYMQLKREFSSYNNQSSKITREQWVEAMSNVLDLPNVDWFGLQPYLAPTMVSDTQSIPQDNTVHRNPQMIDYNRFLSLHCEMVSGGSDQVDAETLDALHQNHTALLTVFKFLDTDRNGSVDREEFRRGILLLSKQNPEDTNLHDPDALFDALDLDGSGELELEEFERAFQAVEMPYSLAVFKLFDTDHSGTIDRKEFRDGVGLLNARLSEEKQIKDVDALFDKIDGDGDGEIDLDEFQRAVDEYFTKP